MCVHMYIFYRERLRYCFVIAGYESFNHGDGLIQFFLFIEFWRTTNLQVHLMTS